MAAIAAGCIELHAAEPGVRAWEGTITLPTWEEGPPDATPHFDALSAERAWYPYAVRASLGKQSPPQVWRTLNLENEYLSCMVLPDLGGHLYNCRDKLSGYEMFHANPSIKKTMIGLRGSWAALGVELNFPVGHSLLTVSPVDFGVAQGTDSASVWVGATDRQTGMRWAVEFSLEHGSAALRQSVLLENPTPVRHRYYWWANAGVTLREDTRFIVPTRLIASHGLTNLDTWPVSASGVDRSVVANYPTGVGLFAHGSREPFFAVYHPKARTGTLHYADPNAVPGKKIWTWGRQDDRRIRAELSDDNSNYVEIQGGLFPNQETYGFFPPWQERAFTEYWMPVRNLDGISQASLDGILYLGRRSSALVAQFLPAHALNGAKVRILNGASPVVEQTVELNPTALFSREIPNPQAAPHTFQLLDRDGKLLLAYTEGEYKVLAPDAVTLGAQPQPDWGKASTEREFLTRAEYNEAQGQFRFATNDYNKALGQFPNSAALLKGAGRLAVEMKRFDNAVDYFSAARQTAPADAESRYYLGLALAGRGDDEEARREWMAVRQDAAFGSAARIAIAAAMARSGDFAAALDALRTAGTVAPKLARLIVVEAALRRSAGDSQGAAAALARARALDPTDFVARYEQLRQGAADRALWEHLAADPERVLEIADEYMRWGLYADALPALEYKYPVAPSTRSEPGAVPPQEYPLVAYYRGFCRERLGQSAAGDYHAASAMPVRYVFPSRAGTLPVLRAALAQNPGDVAAHYLLGLLYLDSGRVTDAAVELRAAEIARPGFGEARTLLGKLTSAAPGNSPPAAPPPARLAVPMKAAWFKGNTHAHTLMSDGDSSPEDLARWYQQHGYDFLFITDHNGVTNVAPLNEALGNGGKFLVIAGQEVTSTMPGGAAVHVNALRPQRSLKEQLGKTAAETLQKDIQTILDAGGIAQINHPNFRWGLTANDIGAVKGAALLEVFNAASVNNYGAGAGFPGTEQIWDLVLSRGVLIWGVASDDTHATKVAWPPDFALPGRGWIVVRAARLAPDDLLDAMARGDFYASNGVEIRDYSADAGQISVAVVEKPDVKYRIQFVGRGEVLQDQTGAAAVYRIRGNEGYVRARVIDSNGRTAWMQPVMPGTTAPSLSKLAPAAPAGAEPLIVPGPAPPVVLGAGGVPVPLAPAPLPPAPSKSPAPVNPPPAAPPPARAPRRTRIPEPPTPAPAAAGIAPNPANPRDIAIAALVAAASGNLPQARAAFNASNFPQEKQEDLVREAYIELQLQGLLALAADRQCGPADQGLTTLGYDDKSLPFTFPGFGAFLKTVRFQYRMGLVEFACGDAKTARRTFERLAKARPELSSPDYAYPSMALSEVNPVEGTARARAALGEVGRSLAKADAASRPTLLYSQGLLQMVLSRTQEAAASFREGAKVSPPGILQYLNLDALRTLDGKRR